MEPGLALDLLNRNIQPRGNEGGRANDAKGERGDQNQSKILGGGLGGVGGEMNGKG